MLQIAPEVVAVEEDATAHDIRMSEVLDAVGVAQSTWWRWRNKGIDPHLRTLRKVRERLDQVIQSKAGGSSSANLPDTPDHGAENPDANISRTEGVAA